MIIQQIVSTGLFVSFGFGLILQTFLYLLVLLFFFSVLGLPTTPVKSLCKYPKRSARIAQKPIVIPLSLPNDNENSITDANLFDEIRPKSTRLATKATATTTTQGALPKRATQSRKKETTIVSEQALTNSKSRKRPAPDSEQVPSKRKKSDESEKQTQPTELVLPKRKTRLSERNSTQPVNTTSKDQVKPEEKPAAKQSIGVAQPTIGVARTTRTRSTSRQSGIVLNEPFQSPPPIRSRRSRRPTHEEQQAELVAKQAEENRIQLVSFRFDFDFDFDLNQSNINFEYRKKERNKEKPIKPSDETSYKANWYLLAFNHKSHKHLMNL